MSGSVGAGIGQALLITAVVAVRFVWIFPIAALDERLLRRRHDRAEPVGWHEMTVASWEELLETARDAVVGSRAESGADPTIVDGVLRPLDARGTDG